MAKQWGGPTCRSALLPAAGLAILALAAGCAARPRVIDAAGAEVYEAYDRAAEASQQDAADVTASRFDSLPPVEPSPILSADEGSEAKGGENAPPAPSSASPPGFLAPLAQSGEVVPVTLEACLRRALVHNLRIQIARFSPAIARTAVAEAEAIFDPSWFLNNALGRLRHDPGSFLAGAQTLVSRQWDFQTGARTLLPTGANVTLAQGWTLLESNSTFYDPNPRYETDIALVVEQPLLRGAGMELTKGPIVLARLDEARSLADFKRQVMDALLEVERTYWELAVAQASVEALRESLQAARENLRIVRLRFQEGKDNRVIVSLASSAVTSRETDLIVARLQRATTSDRLKRLLNDPQLPLEHPTLLAAEEQPLADAIPTTRALFQRAMLAAMKHRPEIRQADARLEQMGLLERVARNERLPRVDLEASYGLQGLDAKTWRAMKEQFGTNLFDWTVGVEIEVPIGNRARTAAYERAKLERAQALLAREDIRQQLLLEVSEAVRNLAAAEEAIAATRAAREAAEQTLRDQQANVGAGAALQKDLLDAQRDLADAKVREIQARAAYMTSLALLQRAQGTLLEYNNIRLLEEEAP
ncbi:MAG: TolC family protein [Phycisphaerae bacterium]